MTLLTGPCVIESEENIFKIARELEVYNEDESIDFYFKASFCLRFVFKIYYFCSLEFFVATFK